LQTNMRFHSSCGLSLENDPTTAQIFLIPAAFKFASVCVTAQPLVLWEQHFCALSLAIWNCLSSLKGLEEKVAWLLVEDDNDIRNVVAVMMSVWGEKPLPFPDGTAAWNWLDSVANGTFKGELPDLALMDIRMPGYTGDKVAARIRQTPVIKDIPIILMTAFSLTDAEIKEMMEQTGIDHLINKPLPDMEIFRSTLYRVRDERRARNAKQAASASTPQPTPQPTTQSPAQAAPQTAAQPAPPALQPTQHPVSPGTQATQQPASPQSQPTVPQPVTKPMQTPPTPAPSPTQTPAQPQTPANKPPTEKKEN
jgi:CheY-like chemotaxis protein